VAVASFLVRLHFPARSTQILDLHLWQWPQCVAMFGLGVVATRHGWQVAVPDRLRRGCAKAVLVTIGTVPVLALLLGISDVAAQARRSWAAGTGRRCYWTSSKALWSWPGRCGCSGWRSVT
jgi:hypothetical protein